MAPPPSLYPSNNHALPELLNVHHRFSAEVSEYCFWTEYEYADLKFVATVTTGGCVKLFPTV